MNQRKNLIISCISASAALLAGCASDEPILNATDGDAIAFDTYLSRNVLSRAETTDITSLKTKGFGVFAYYTAQSAWSDLESDMQPNFMNNQKVFNNDGNWYYSPLKYWPKNETDKISYFAYAPYSDNVSVSESGAPVIKYNIINNGAIDNDAMCDLVAARHIDMNSAEHPDRTIKFNFEHTLSRVSLKAKSANVIYDATNPLHRTEVHITELSIGGINASGALDLQDSSWDDLNASSDYVSLANVGKFTSCTLDNESVNAILINSNTATSILKSDEYLFLIPQEEKLSIKLSYDVVTYDEKLANGYAITHVKDAVVDTDKDLVQGKSYTFTLNISLDAVMFDADVEDWTIDNGTTGGEEDDDESDDDSDSTTTESTSTGFNKAEVSSLYLFGNEFGWTYEDSQIQERTKLRDNGDGTYYLVVDHLTSSFTLRDSETEVFYGHAYNNAVEDSNKLYENTPYVLDWGSTVDHLYVDKTYQRAKIVVDLTDKSKPTLTITEIFEKEDSAADDEYGDKGFYLYGYYGKWFYDEVNRFTYKGNGIYELMFPYQFNTSSDGFTISTNSNYPQYGLSWDMNYIELNETTTLTSGNRGIKLKENTEYQNVKITFDYKDKTIKVEQL